MKTLCAALVLLSLISVCQPASLACEKLVNPARQEPDMTGRWYLIAVSSESCLQPTFINAFLWPSVAVDAINHYSGVIYIKIHGLCFNKTIPADSANSHNTPADGPDELLQTGCPDCLVFKDKKKPNILLFLSRRTAVTAAELTEFETQAECLGLFKPQVLNTDHDYGNCKSIEDINEDDSIQVLQSFFQKMLQRVTNTHDMITKCVAASFLSYLPSLL